VPNGEVIGHEIHTSETTTDGAMVDPVNLNVPGLDYPFFAIVFCGVVALFTLVLARAEIALQRKRRTIVTRGSALLESHRIEGRLEWVVVRGRDALEQAGRERMRRPPQGQRQDGKREGEHEHVFSDSATTTLSEQAS
jgi:hypothetical protein